MKKLTFLTAALLLMTTIASAQFYVQGGLNLANISKNNAGETNDYNQLATFNAGIMGRFGISKVFDLETGLLFTGRGSKSNTYFGSTTDNNYVKSKFNPYYIELPLNAVIKFPMGGTSNIFVNAGPYIAMGVAGKSKVETRFAGITSTSTDDISFNNDDPTTTEQEGAAYNKLKRFDFGANVGAGIDIGALIFKVNCGIGFSKINSTDNNNSSDDKNKYRTLSFSVGIPIGR